MYQKLTYGCDGKGYVRLKLSQQGTLWRLLAQQPIERGQVFGYLPPTATDSDVPFFEWHLHSREDLEAGRVDREYTARERDFIAERLVEGVGRLGIFHGARAAPGMKTRTVDLEDVTTYYGLVLDRNSYHPEIPIATETYYIVNGSLTRPRLDYVLDNVAERLPFFGVLTWLPPDQALPGDKRLSETFLTDLARSADIIVAGAYGGDANLIWTRGMEPH